MAATALTMTIGHAAAKDVRYPEKGPVAFVIHLPDDWSGKVDDYGNFEIGAPDHSAGLSLSVFAKNAQSAAQTDDEFANAAFDAAKAEHFSRKETSSISGVAGTAYYSRLVNPSGVNAQIKMILIRAVRDYDVSESTLTLTKLSSAQQRALDNVLQGIVLTGVTPNPPGSNPPGSKGTANPTPTEVSLSPTQTETRSNATRFEIPLKSLGGTFVVPGSINGAATVNFIVDSGAADVSVPADVVRSLVKSGAVDKSDFTGKQTYVLADGSTVPASTFIIRSLKVGDVTIENVKGSMAPAGATGLLGQTFLQRFKWWSMNNNRHVLILDQVLDR
jgi:clan AA aspartic protease (TIGR02281 family)